MGRATDAEMVAILDDVVTEMIKFTPNREIVQIIEAKYGKSRAQCYIYLKKALEIFTELSLNNLEGERNKQKEFLSGRIRENLRLAAEAEEDASRSKYESLAISWYDRYLKMFPAGLMPELEEKSRQLNITFNSLPATVTEFFEPKGDSDSYEYRGYKVIKNKQGKNEITGPDGNTKITTVDPKEWIDNKLK